MQLYNIKKSGVLSRVAVMALICSSVSACNSMDVSYISRDIVKGSAFAQEKPNYTEKKPMSLGALRLTNKDANEGEAGKLLLLQRKKSVYMAETMVKGEGKKRYFFSVGVDYKSKAPAIGFRMEF